jgi:diguanylate cyclase (GGDEF)-like protein
MAQEGNNQAESKMHKVMQALKRSRGIVENGYAGNPEILARVKDYEVRSAASDQSPQTAVRPDDLDRLALLDPLTELHSHRAFLKELRAELKRAARYKYGIAMCMFNVDGFDGVIQQYGQLTGDAVLKVVANVLKASRTEDDIATVYGAPVFAWAMPKTSLSSAALIAEKVRQKIGNQAITHNWQNFSVTTSIGIASFPDHAHEYDELIARATEVMEQAIERGGDRVIVV